MIVEFNVFALIPVIVVIYYVIRWLDGAIRKRLGIDLQSEFLENIAKLQGELEKQQKRHKDEMSALRREYEKQIAAQQQEFERKITQQHDEMEERVNWLLEQLKAEGVKVKALETQMRNIPQEQNEDTLAKPLLLICGGVSSFCTADRMAIRKAGVAFHRMLDATTQKIEGELRRRRSDNTLYKWVHVSGHASAAGVKLGEIVVAPPWWNETLIGIDVLFLAACETVDVADALAGMMTVVSTTEEIENKDAADFTYIFWRQMNTHGNPGRAYQEALLAVPQVAEFTDIRLGGSHA